MRVKKEREYLGFQEKQNEHEKKKMEMIQTNV